MHLRSSVCLSAKFFTMSQCNRNFFASSKYPCDSSSASVLDSLLARTIRSLLSRPVNVCWPSLVALVRVYVCTCVYVSCCHFCVILANRQTHTPLSLQFSYQIKCLSMCSACVQFAFECAFPLSRNHNQKYNNWGWNRKKPEKFLLSYNSLEKQNMLLLNIETLCLCVWKCMMFVGVRVALNDFWNAEKKTIDVSHIYIDDYRVLTATFDSIVSTREIFPL